MRALAIVASFWAANVPVGRFAFPGGNLTAIVDTGGTTELRKTHPKDFATYYHGLHVDAAIGADYLRDHAIELGSVSANADSVSLDVRTVKHQTTAFVRCTIAQTSYRMLLDTAALAWKSTDTGALHPLGVIYLGRAAFDGVARRLNVAVASAAYRIVDGRGRFIAARSLIAPNTRCGDVQRKERLIVERTDSSTYAGMKQTTGLDVDGDVSLSAFEGSGLLIDFPHKHLVIGSVVG
jgi:hypothetical protein